jgi:hypothetical protein
MPQSKQCAECGATFTRKPRRSHAQWANQTCCTTACANTVRGKQQTKLPSTLRREGERWARWWEQQRRREDQVDLARSMRHQRRLDKATSGAAASRQFIGGSCPDCGDAVVVVRGWWHGSIRCSACTKARWRETHYQRAARYGTTFDVIKPERVFERDGWRCQICRRKTSGKWPSPKSPSLDHIVPMARGGHHIIENLQCACLACNVRKGARSANDQLRLGV